MASYTNILNIQINTEKKSVILDRVEKLLQDEKQHYIVTPNPEIVMYSTQDREYLEILNQADIKIPDGIGLKFASYLTKNKIKQRIKGVEFIKDLCRLAEQKKYSVFFLGGEDEEVAVKTAKTLQTKFTQLIIKGAQSGGRVDKNGLLQNEEILAKIKKEEPNILVVAFGFPKQEKFINRYLAELPSVKLAIGVGGSFDFISWNIKRAPKFFRVIGLEWLWRLMMEPKRWRRIYNAVIKFPIMFLRWRKQK